MPGSLAASQGSKQPTMLPACRYDSTIGAESGSRRRWPGTMDDGVGFDCEVAGQECSRSERHPGLW